MMKARRLMVSPYSKRADRQRSWKMSQGSKSEYNPCKKGLPQIESGIKISDDHGLFGRRATDYAITPSIEEIRIEGG